MSWFRWLGALTAALSLYSLAEHLYRLPVLIVFGDVINYYRLLTYPVVGLAEKVVNLTGWHIHFPRDPTVLYLLVGASLTRFDLYTETERGRAAAPAYILIPSTNDTIRRNKLETLAYRILRPIVFTLMWPTVFIIFVGFLLDKDARHGALMLLRYLGSGLAVELVRTLAVFVLFVAVNGAAPSLFN